MSERGERSKRKKAMQDQDSHAAEARDEQMEAQSQPSDADTRLREETRRAEEYRELLQRVQADFINYKRRVEQERIEQIKFANSMLILKILPILDDLERASDTVQADLAGLNWVQGILLIERKLRTVLAEEGLAKIEAQDAEFDPRFHEAVVYEEATDDNVDRVVAVLQNGYTLNDKVIRPAIVKVAGRRGVTAEDAPKQ